MGKHETVKRIDISKYVKAYSSSGPVTIKSGGSASAGTPSSTLTHSTLLGLTADDHPQYPNVASSESISGTWTFASNRIVIGSGSDEDVTLFTVYVTGSPVMTWDESEDSFALTKGLDVTGSVDATTITGANVTSGEDPGHTHTEAAFNSEAGVLGAVLTADGTDAADWILVCHVGTDTPSGVWEGRFWLDTT